MAAIFSKNGILSGHLDYYCLVCSEKFTTEDATLAHIIDLIHKDKLKTRRYVENYTKDFIRKDKGIYYCEPCSLTFPTAQKAELHIDESHLDQRKKRNPLNRLKNDIIAFNQFIISNDAWNGCIEDTCVLCNTALDDSASHKTIHSHVLNLIKSEVFFDESNNTIYRTIDDKSKQCITCNVIIGNDTTSHFATAEHTEAYKLWNPPTIQQDDTEITTLTSTKTHNGKPNNEETGKNEAINVFNGNINNEAHKNVKKDVKINTDKNDSNKTSSKDEESIPYESIERYQKSNVNINLINETAFCRKCSKNVDFNTTAIDKHIEEHKKIHNKKSPETLSSEIKSNGTEKTTLYTKPVLLKDKHSPKKNVSIGDYAKQHGFSHNVADCSYYCRPCSRRLNPTLEDLQKHVASKIHTENTKQSSKNDTNNAPVKEPLLNCINIFDMVETMNQGHIIFINNKYWLDAFSFFMVGKINERFFCHGCQIYLTRANVMQHVALTGYHREIIEKSFFITSLGNEFIREIRLDVYHCGYCNITENVWDDMLDHIAMEEHKRQKAQAAESLRQHQPNLYNRYTPKQVEDMIRLFSRGNP